MQVDVADAGELGYELELARRLATLMELWGSPRFRSGIVSTTGTGLGVTESRMLWELGFRGPTRPGVLAVEIGIGAPSITKAAARLRERGLLTTGADPADGRAALLELTPEGRETTHELYRLGDDMMRRLTASWSDAEVAALTGMLARLTDDALAFADALDADAER
ncbi:MAG: hypothetical protein DI534_06260 [Leifsonia xyli]|nr:MAG: hypothetical protein DI534_06260 [Leifsonia xyli]